MPTEFATPNAVMRTYASPSLTGSALAVWRAEMEPGAAGPLHAASGEQVLVVLDGELTVAVRGSTSVLAPGDSIAIPAGAERRLSNAGSAPVALVACSTPAPTATVRGGEPQPCAGGGCQHRPVGARPHRQRRC
jgi:quercetin dioxygenase-like cupin family protein